jgi:hypothetical protein
MVQWFGDKSIPKAACQDFRALWKDVDPDIPVVEQPKTEYGRLQ